MRRALVALALVLSLSACDDTSGDYEPSDPGGLGVTYRGKPGIDLGGGLVMGSDGRVAPGFGF